MVTIIKDEELTKVSDSVKPDSKRRVVLPSSVVRKDVTYHIYCNRFGQIVLDPQVTIPASEAWLYKNPVALKLVGQGLEDIAKGRLVKGKRSDL
jgi:hypothetical protein